MQIGERQRIDALLDQFTRFFIITVVRMPLKYRRRLDGERAVHIDGKIAVTRHQLLFLDLTDEVKHFLRASDSKGRNDHIAAAVERPLNHFCQFSHVIRLFVAVTPVTVRGFHNHVIRLRNVAGIADDRLIQVADIARKNNFFRHAIFCEPQFDARGPQQMPGIDQTHPDAVCDVDHLIIGLSRQERDSSHGVFHGKRRDILRFSQPLPLAVPPLGLKFLDMRAVAKHDVAQICRGLCGIDRPAETLCIQHREIARMIDMCVCKQNKIEIRRRHGKISVLIEIFTLLHTVVDQKFLSRSFQIITAAGYLMIRPDKHQFHVDTCPFSEPSAIFKIPSLQYMPTAGKNAICDVLLLIHVLLYRTVFLHIHKALGKIIAVHDLQHTMHSHSEFFLLVFFSGDPVHFSFL